MRRTRRGYSFTEVMFAVVVLGIGFIMIAAMFPVAISQQQSTQQETNAAAIARAAANYFETVANMPSPPAPPILLPPTGTPAQPTRPIVFSIRNPQSNNAGGSLPTEDLWNALKGQLIVAGDQRYGMVMLYRREGQATDPPETWQSRAQLIVIVTQVRNRSTYKPGEDIYKPTAPSPPNGYNLQARPAVCTITPDGTGPDVEQIVTFDTGGGNAAIGAASVAEGSYIVVADDNLPGVNEGVMNGYIYRVGARREDLGPGKWELAPGNDFRPYDPNGTPPPGPINGLTDANVFVVGRNATDTDGVYDGPAQDIAVYTTFIQVR